MYQVNIVCCQIGKLNDVKCDKSLLIYNSRIKSDNVLYQVPQVFTVGATIPNNHIKLRMVKVKGLTLTAISSTAGLSKCP